MITAKPDLTMKEVPPPHNRWCQAGHCAPDRFAREGTGSALEPTRFFQVGSKANPNVNGVYCEPCLIIANYGARKTRETRSNGK